MNVCFNQAGEPMTVEAWSVAFIDFEYRQVGDDTLQVGDENVRISTVWFGLDQGHGMTDRSMIFESMIFGGPMDETRRIYATRDEAIAGHAELVGEVLQLAQERQ